ncbi:Kinesin-like protein KIN-4C [Linum perenne]
MDNTAECVKVAVNIRPLITPELLNGCTDCITLVPGEPQTGSGKTYTMGTNYSGEGTNEGVIPKFMDTIFRRFESVKESTEFLIRVSFIEIFKEEVFDLLDSNTIISKGEGGNGGKGVVHPRVPIQIRETVNGGITLAGVTEAEVRCKEEMGAYLSKGSLARATGSTNMNNQSSRSHAIFTISMEQKKITLCSNGVNNDDMCDDILRAKLHLVDLAGSERAKRTGADGLRFKEGIHINKGLLALGNVISALGDEKKRKEGGHDSLGGNSKTVMIACVSPADTNAEETLNTLKYANRARNIQNKAVINRDPNAVQLQRMRSQIEQLQAELCIYRGDANAPFDEIQILKHKVALLEASNGELHKELQERQMSFEHLNQRAIDAQVEKDKLIMQIESIRNGKSWDEIDAASDQDADLVRSYVSRIQDLEGELLRIKNSKLKHTRFVDCVDSDDEGLHSGPGLFPPTDGFSSMSDTKYEAEVEEKELEHSSMQERLDRELKELDRRLEQKEAEMKRFTGDDTSVIKQHYEKKVHDLEQEKRKLQKEIAELKGNISNISSTPDDGTKKLKEEYLQKLTILEAQVSELKKKQDAQAQQLRQKQKSDEAARKLQEEIHRIKTQKVQLQHKIKQESEQFRLWKASREKEVLQLKKEGRRNEYEMHKLLALNQRQKMVLQRKTEEASLATKRLKDLLESKKASSRELSKAVIGFLYVKALMQAVEHELEVSLRVHAVRSEYERQVQERGKIAQELARLKEETEMLKKTNSSESPSTMSPGVRNSRIFALENMLATSSSTLVSMASQLSEAEESGKGFSGRGRWNHVKSLVDAKNLMNHLFNLASSSRCMLRDKEVDCREKDSEIRDLKGKIVNLSGFVRHLEKQKAELIHQVKIQSSALKNMENGGRKYDLRKLPPRSSIFMNEDMDTSISDHSDSETNDEDDEWVRSTIKKTRKTSSRTGGLHSRSPSDNTDSSSSGDGEDSRKIQPAGQCCSCSRKSSCKTTKCECLAAGGMCGASCGCSASKCSNRDPAAYAIANSEIDAEMGGASGSDESSKNKINELASHGAMLLENAMFDKPAAARQAEDDVSETQRKPLSDIGNTKTKSDAPKENKRKKWRKSVIQLIPVAPTPSSTQPESNNGEAQTAPLATPSAEAPRKAESANSKGGETDKRLKLPRAMRAPGSSRGVLLRERNASGHGGDESHVHKEGGGGRGRGNHPPTRSPARPARPTDEKENYSR